MLLVSITTFGFIILDSESKWSDECIDINFTMIYTLYLILTMQQMYQYVVYLGNLSIKSFILQNLILLHESHREPKSKILFDGFFFL